MTPHAGRASCILLETRELQPRTAESYFTLSKHRSLTGPEAQNRADPKPQKTGNA